MMKYFEKRKKEILKEMNIYEGSMNGSAVREFFSDIIEYKNKTKIINLIKQYFKNIVGTSLKKYTDRDIVMYIEILSYDYNEIKNLPKVVKSLDVISNLAYFLTKNLLKLRKGVNCEYAIYKHSGNLDKYYFFDSELEELFGFVTLRDSQFSEVKKYCGSKKIQQVSTSMSDKELQGTGIGKNMYLTLINEFGCMASDTSLFYSSLNIWVNVLPKYFDVYHIDNDKIEEDSVVPISKRPKNWNDVEILFAVKR